MDEFVRKNGAVRNQYGVLGSDNRDGSSFLIHKAMRFDSKGGRIPDVISDNYEKLAPSADTRLRVNRSGIQQKIIMKFLHI